MFENVAIYIYFRFALPYHYDSLSLLSLMMMLMMTIWMMMFELYALVQLEVMILVVSSLEVSPIVYVVYVEFRLVLKRSLSQRPIKLKWIDLINFSHSKIACFHTIGISESIDDSTIRIFEKLQFWIKR